MDYNTSRNKLFLPEYGRNIQKLVEQAIVIEDREERNKAAHAIIRIMGNIHPHLRDISEFTHKLWDHLQFLANFKLDIDAPYQLPDRILEDKPQRIEYPNKRIQYKHFGRIIESLIQVAVDETDPEKKTELIQVIIRQMRKSYVLWSREGANDEAIFNAISKLSENQLIITDEIKQLSYQRIHNEHQNTNSGSSRPYRKKIGRKDRLNK